MYIKWFGHSFFQVTTDTGKSIAMDPFDYRVGYKVPNIKADIVTVSHNHFDHSKVNIINGCYKCITKEGEYDFGDVKIKGIKSSHGFMRGKNLIYVIKTEGLTICHCGDLGKILTLKQVNEIGHVDVLMLPIGGATQVLDCNKAKVVLEQLKPKIAIPMHYKTDASNVIFALSNRVEPFLKSTNGIRLGAQELKIDSSTIKKYTGVVVFDYE